MFHLYKDKSFIVLAILLGITLFSWFTLYAIELEPKTIGTLLLFFAFVKVQIIVSQYMELHKAILPIRIAFWLWTVAVAAMSIGMYWR